MILTVIMYDDGIFLKKYWKISFGLQ